MCIFKEIIHSGVFSSSLSGNEIRKIIIIVIFKKGIGKMLPQIQNKVISKKGIVSTKPKLNC